MTDDERVDDIFAFAARSPDYWDLLTGSWDPGEDTEVLPGLTEEESTGFAAAREHVRSSYADLLEACLEAVAERAEATGDDRFKPLWSKHPNRASTESNGCVWVTLLTGRGRATTLHFTVEPDNSGRSVRLYSRLDSRAENIGLALEIIEGHEELKPLLRGLWDDAEGTADQPPVDGPSILEDGGSIWLGHFLLPQNEPYANLAAKLADLVWPLLGGYLPGILKRPDE